MINTDNGLSVLDEGSNRIFVDLVFILASGECFKNDCTYEEQLKYYVNQVISDCASIDSYIEFGQKYRMSSKYMFPGRPDRIKKRGLLIKFFSSFVVFKALFDCKSLSKATNAKEMADGIHAQFVLTNDEDEATFEKEVGILTRRYADLINEDIYNKFLTVMTNVADDFDDAYSKIVSFVVGDDSVAKVGSFASLLEAYKVSESDATKFHLEVDAIAETVVIKNLQLEYEDEFKSEWEKHFPQYRYCNEVAEYVKTKKSAFVLCYGNNISSIRNENFLFDMLADVTVKLALVDGAKNVYELTKKVKDLTKELGDNIKGVFIDSRKHAIRVYHLSGKEDYSEDLRSVLIPYRTDLMYIRDIIIEEISYRNAGNIVQRESRATKDSSEYELLLSQKDAEIYELKHELEYYENIKQQEFKAEISQYNRALTDLFRKMCDFKYGSPLNELYLLANGVKDFSQENTRGILQNLLFILSTMNIVPYETGNVGKKVKFYDDEANMVYAVEDDKVKEGLNQGVQVYPGWKYKDTELVLPKVDIEEE